MIAAGTGILPFIDLLDFLLKKEIYNKLKKEGRDTSVVKPVQNYDNIFPGARFKLLSAFRTLDDFIGVEWINELCKISKETEDGLFECITRLGGNYKFEGVRTINSKFNANFLEGQQAGSFDKIWVCATPQMQASIYTDLISIGVDEARINFV